MKKTKMICTVGPASETEEIITQFIEAGMNASRHNFSHGDHEEHRGRIELVRNTAKKLGKEIAIILDTKGPEIRTGKFEPNKVELQKGTDFTIYAVGCSNGNNSPSSYSVYCTFTVFLSMLP